MAGGGGVAVVRVVGRGWHSDEVRVTREMMSDVREESEEVTVARTRSVRWGAQAPGEGTATGHGYRYPKEGEKSPTDYWWLQSLRGLGGVLARARRCEQLGFLRRLFIERDQAAQRTRSRTSRACLLSPRLPCS